MILHTTGIEHAYVMSANDMFANIEVKFREQNKYQSLSLFENEIDALLIALQDAKNKIENNKKINER